MIKYYVSGKEWAGGSFSSLLCSVNCYCVTEVPYVPKGWATSCSLQTLCLDYSWALKCYIRWDLALHFIDAFRISGQTNWSITIVLTSLGRGVVFGHPSRFFKEFHLVATAASFYVIYNPRHFVYLQCYVNLFLKFVVITVNSLVPFWHGLLYYFSYHLSHYLSGYLYCSLWSLFLCSFNFKVGNKIYVK